MDRLANRRVISWCDLRRLATIDHFADYKGDKSSANEEFVHMVAEQNVRLTIAGIRARGPILADMESAGEIKIVGGMYDMETGTVTFFQE